ncbi:MAG: hypothetical protein IKW74_03300, partial [Thermoguttaceae bacterium]|nr:hypothetical protein [Thermoguttaceae bacterium]
MKKGYIRPIVFAAAFAVIASVYNYAQAQTPAYVPKYTPVLSDDGTYLTGLPIPNVVLQKKDNSTYPNGIYWDTTGGWWVWKNSGNPINNPLVSLQGQNCYVQDRDKTNQNYSTIGGPLELRANGQTEFWGNALFIGVNTYLSNSSDPNSLVISTFTNDNNQMRFSNGVDATMPGNDFFDDESMIVYDSTYAVSMDNIYLGNGIINNRLTEHTNQYAVVGITGNLYILPDTNNDNKFRSIIANDNKNRHMIVDENCTIICPEGAKLEMLSNTWNNNDTEVPFAVFPICGNIEGAGNVRYYADREDTIYVLGDNEGFTGVTRIHTDKDETSDRFRHSFVVSGNGTSDSGIKGREIYIETGNLVLQNNHTLKNLGSDRKATSSTRLLGSDAITENPFVSGYHYPEAHDKTEIVTLYNDTETTYYGSISGAHEEQVTVDGISYHTYAFTGSMKKLIKDGDETLNLYCAGSDGGIRAESFVISSGRINFNGYFEGTLSVEAGTVFSPDSWGWGKDAAI